MLTKNKIIIISSVALISIMGLLYAIHASASKSASSVHVIEHHVFPSTLAVQELKYGIVRIVASINELLVLSASRDLKQQGRNIASENEEEELVSEGIEVFEAALIEFKHRHEDAGEFVYDLDNELLASLENEYQGFKSLVFDIRETSEKPFDPVLAATLKEQLEDKERSMLSLIEKLATVEIEENFRLVKTTVSSVQNIEERTYILGLIASFILLIFSAILITTLSKEAAVRKEAEDANRAKDSFLASMSHELRTPMNAIMGFSQLLIYNTKEPLSETQHEYVDHIMAGGNHLMVLIEQVLYLSEIEAGTLTPSPETVQINDLCQDCLAMITQPAAKKELTIRHDLTATKDVLADKSYLRQSLFSLLSNAIKYNINQGVITLLTADVPGKRVRIEVSDTGEGILPEHHGNVFKAFDRLGREAGTIEGTGIGLAIVKQLVEKMGGNIGFESEIGKGSTFWLDLPSVDDSKES